MHGYGSPWGNSISHIRVLQSVNGLGAKDRIVFIHKKTGTGIYYSTRLPCSGRVIYHSKNLLWVGLPRNVGAFIPVVNIRINTEVRGGQRGQGSVTGLGGGENCRKII